MRDGPVRKILLVWALSLFNLAAPAQVNLPGVTVTAPAYTEHHGGYLISGDFKVDPRMPYVAYPAQALVRDDILSIQPVHLGEDEYLVLQECAVADCREARIVRVWNAGGATGPIRHSENRIWIRHENKYFIWLMRLPEVPVDRSCGQCGSYFTTFDPVSPPLTLIPGGALAARGRAESQAGEQGPLPVRTQAHEGATFVITFAGGSTVRIRRMHAERTAVAGN
jgi:hypothetical protein